jgi:heme exporter protein D
MRHTTFHRNNRMRLQKIHKKLAREAKLAKKQGKAKAKAAQAKPA